MAAHLKTNRRKGNLVFVNIYLDVANNVFSTLDII